MYMQADQFICHARSNAPGSSIWEILARWIFADTVGFIRHLPHDLVAAFKATLTETRDADLLIHVVDSFDERRDENQREVNSVLEEIGAHEVPQLLVFNKLDLMEGVTSKIDYNDEGVPERVWLSAQTGEGIELLKQALHERLAPKMVETTLRVPPAEGKLRSRLYAMQCVQGEQANEVGDMLISVRMPDIEWQRLKKQFGERLEKFIN